MIDEEFIAAAEKHIARLTWARDQFPQGSPEWRKLQSQINRDEWIKMKHYREELECTSKNQTGRR